MARVLILGGGFGGVSTALTLRAERGDADEIVLVSKKTHFMVGFRKTWAMFELAPLGEGLRPLSALERRGIRVVHGTVESIDPATRSAVVDGRRLEGDALVVALGVRHAPERIPGFSEHALNAYALDGMDRVTRALRDFPGGRIVTGVFGVPYQCPPAPYEIAILTREYFTRRGVDAEISVVTPKPMALPPAGKAASDRVRQRLAEFGVELLTGHTVTAVEADAVVCGDRRLPCDMALGVPPHVAVDVVRASPLAAEDGWVAADRHTLETGFDDVYAVGDCTRIPIGKKGQLPKAGLIAETEGEVVGRRIAARLAGREPEAVFEGRAHCYIEVGREEAAVIGGHFLAEPGPDLALSDMSHDHYLGKLEFERNRLERWFG